MVRMRVGRRRVWGTARSVAAAVAAAVVIAGPGAPSELGAVGGERVALAAATSVHPAQGDGPQDSGSGGDPGGGNSGGTNVSGNASGGDDKSSGDGEASAPEPTGSRDGGDAPSSGEAVGSGPAKVETGSSASEAKGTGRTEPNTSVGDSAQPQRQTIVADGKAQQPTAGGKVAGQSQVVGSTTAPGTPAEGGPQAAVSNLNEPVGGDPESLGNAKLLVGDPTQPASQPTTTSLNPVAPGTPPTLAQSNGVPITLDKGSQGTLEEYRASLPPEARSQPLDFGSTVVTPDQRNALVAQEGGDVDRVNSAIQDVAAPGSEVTQSQVLLRDDTGRFGNQTVFQVTGKDGKPQLIDAQGATYKDVNDYLENNQLDDSWTMIRPANLGTPGEGTQQLVSGPAHNTTFSQGFGGIVDEVAPYAGVAGGAVVTAAALAGEPITGGAATPAVLGGWALMTGSAAAIAARSGEDLFKRYQHNRSISPSDPQARADYLGLIGGLGGGAGIAGKMAARPLMAAGGDSVAFGAGGQSLVDGGTQLYNNWGSLTPEQRSEQFTQLATGGALMVTPLAGRGGPRGEGPFLPGKGPTLAEIEAERAARAAGGGPARLPKDGLTRQDSDFNGMYNPKGDLKSHLDDRGNVFPANPNGGASVIDHIVGRRAKSESPYTSWSGPGSNPKDFGGTNMISLDRARLERDIASGRVRDVEIVPPEKVQRLLQEDANRVAGRNVDISVPDGLDPDTLKAEAKRISKSIDGLSSKNRAQIYQRVIDLSNTRRDGEWLTKGIVPQEYVVGPYPR